jgi:ADP-heptose:LPS heptosyltransferase
MGLKKSIAIVRQGGLGDHIVTTPLVRAIRIAEPSAKITMFSGHAYCSLWEENPCVNRVIPVKAVFETSFEGQFSVDRFLEPIAGVSEKFDLIFNPTHCVDVYLNGLIVNKLKADIKIGFKQEMSEYEGYDANIFYTQLINRPKYENVSLYSELIFRELYPKEKFSPYDVELFFCQEAHKNVTTYIASLPSPDIVGIHPAGSINYRTLSALQLKEIVNQVQRMGLIPIIIGENSYQLEMPGVFFTGRIKIPELFCLVSKMKAVICVDSSIKHIAGAFEVPIIELSHIPRHLLKLNGPYVDESHPFCAINYWAPKPGNLLHEVVFPVLGQSEADIKSGLTLHSIGLGEISDTLSRFLKSKDKLQIGRYVC